MLTRPFVFASVSVSALSLGSLVVGCSSSESNGNTPAASVGGTTTADTGGSSTTGGNVSASGGTFATGGTSAVNSTGGTTTAPATGGASSPGTGGTKPTGGSSASETATGGAETGGTSAGNTDTSGVTSSGGRTSSGGTSTSTAGGTTATGGKSTVGGATAGGATIAGGTQSTGGSSGNNGGTATKTIPGNGCTPPAAYANLFVGLSGHTQEETDAKLAAGWAQLFNPSGANTIYYNGPGSDESYVEDIGNGDVRSEGMSYGMMIAVQLDKHTEFDRLWTWVKNHMAQGTGQICWQNHTDGSKMSGGGAPDGEEYFATALIFASKRWGDSGKYNYASEAKWILNSLRTTYFNSTYHIVQFVAGSGNTDASYILPSFYQTWACFDTANAAYWNAAITAGRNFFHSAIDSNGVIGDQSSFTGQTTKAAGPDTIRCVANIMMDHNFFNVDAWQTETYAPKYSAYVTSHAQNSTAATAANGLLGFGLPESSGKAFVDKVWSTSIPTGQWRYYDGCWYMMSLLHLSGNFRLWY